MPIKKDETGKHWVELQFVVTGTPEQVWQAMATSSGNAAWFTQATIEERVGGALEFRFGSEFKTTGEVTMWEPPHRFGYVERQWAEGAPPLATEITIATRSGGQCVVRMVHSLFSSTDDWDDQMEGFESGWSAFIEVLRVYLGHFAGMRASSFQIMQSVQQEHGVVWARLLEGFGLAGANVDDRRALPHPENLSVVVERIHQDHRIRSMAARLDAPMAGVLVVSTSSSMAATTVSFSAFIYGSSAEAYIESTRPKWEQWLREQFAS